MSNLLTGCYLANQTLVGDSAGDMFGNSVATNSDGTLLMMGGPFDGAGGEGAGAALVYIVNPIDGSWQLKQKLAGDSAGDMFGNSVATNSDGTLLMMGGPFDGAGGEGAGAALVYTGGAAAGWQLRQKLTGDSAGDQFGTSVATNSAGTVLIMGGNWTNVGGTSVGAALVYTGSVIAGWQLRQKLTGDSASDGFGISVATNSDGTLLMMGGNDNAAGGINAGAVLVYTGNSVGGWKLKQKFTGDSALNLFGYSIATNSSGTLLIMGGYDANTATGAALVYTGSAVAGWQLEQKLMSDSTLDLFGYSIATNSSGNLLIMGKPFDDTGGTSAGAALVHTLSNTPCPSSSSSSSSSLNSECINQCLNTGSLYYTKDTFINLYNETGSGMFIENKKVDTSRLLLLTSNESWLDYGQEFSGYGLSGFNNQEAGIILKLNDSIRLAAQNIFHFNYGINDSRDIVGNYHKQLISIRPQKPTNSGYLGYFANDRAWATYDVSTGMVTGSLTRNNVFSYAIDIVASGVLSGKNFYYTGDVDVSTPTGQAYVSNLEKNPILYIENFNALTTLSFNGIQDFCDKVQECEDPEEPEPLEICYTGELTDTAAFRFFLSGVESTANAVIINRPEKEDLLSNIGTGSEIKHPNTIYSGYILYNNWQSGDYIKWNLYNFNFVDLYQEYHLGNFPPYPNTGFTLYYPNDFNSLDSLVDKLNQNVDVLKTYPVWYPYDCLKDTESGIFLTGALMKFSKNTETTGDLPISHFNNRIDFISYRSFPQLEETDDYLSYGISIFSPIKPETRFFQGWSYLIPTTIQLEGLNRDTQNWEILDINGRKPGTNSLQYVSLLSNNNNSSYVDSLLTGEIASLLTGESVTEGMGDLPLDGVTEEEEEEEESLPEGELPPAPPNCKDVIYTNIQRNISFNKNPLCPPKLFLRNVIVTAPKEECKLEKTVDKNGNIVPKYSNAQLCADGDGGGGGGEGAGGADSGGGGDGQSIGDWHLLRTGWNTNNLGGGGALSLDFKIQNINSNIIYDKYKVSLSDFISVPNPKLVQKDSFFIRRIKLYTLDKANFDIHKGPELCTIGADYIIDVSGLMPVEVSGIWNYNILPEESGVYRFFKTPFTRPIEEDERLVVFNKISGKIISENATGFLSTSGFGVGNVSYTDSSRYFYNPLTQSVYFSESLTGIVTGFGILSGEKIAIKQSVINQELLLGGRLANSPAQYHEILSDGTFTSSIDDVEFVQYDVLGFYPITGKVTGITTSGMLNINNQVIMTGSPIGDRFAYYPVPTGFTFSEVLLNINYNNINNFDYISINNNDIVFNTDTSLYPAPSYFDSNETFVSIINASSDVFLCSGEIINSDIRLYSTLKGASGDLNIVTNSTGVTVLEKISGRNIFPRLYKIVTERNLNCIDDDPAFINLPGNCTYSFNRVTKDPIMTGNILDALLATGFYFSNQGSGNITGDVMTFVGVRNFFDVWDIATGNLRRSYFSFLENNFISGNSYFRNSQFGTAPGNINLRAFYLNYLNTTPAEETDVADLIIKDLNNPNLSETGIIFRLNGLR